MTRNEMDRVGGAVERWWRRELAPEDEGERGDRAARARLRRAETPGEALLEPATIQLYSWVRQALGKETLDDGQAGAVAVLAAVLAEVGTSRNLLFAEQLGKTPDGLRPGKEDRRVMSPLRFGNLMRADGPDELLRHLRRAVALLGDRPFNVRLFAADLLAWNDDVRRRWVFQYHQEGDAAPAPTDSQAEETPA